MPGEYALSRTGEMLRCPWHGWEFDLRTGQSWWSPARRRARPYPVSVTQGAGLQQGPYVTETFTVAVAEEYVLVEIE